MAEFGDPLNDDDKVGLMPLLLLAKRFEEALGDPDEVLKFPPLRDEPNEAVG